MGLNNQKELNGGKNMHIQTSKYSVRLEDTLNAVGLRKKKTIK